MPESDARSVVLNTSKLYKVHEPHQRFVLKHSLILAFPFLSSLLWCSTLQKFVSPGSNILLLFWLMIFSLVFRCFCQFWKCVRFCFCFCCCLFLFVVCTCILCLLPCLTRRSFIDVISCTPTGVSEINYLTWLDLLLILVFPFLSRLLWSLPRPQSSPLQI